MCNGDCNEHHQTHRRHAHQGTRYQSLTSFLVSVQRACSGWENLQWFRRIIFSGLCELQGGEQRSVYAVSGVDWGYFRDVHLKKKEWVSKHWNAFPCKRCTLARNQRNAVSWQVVGYTHHQASALKCLGSLRLLQQEHWISPWGGRLTVDFGTITHKGGCSMTDRFSFSYWYLGPVKHRWAYLRATVGGWPPNIRARLVYRDPCEGCSRCVPPPSQTPWRWWHFFVSPKQEGGGKCFKSQFNFSSCSVLTCSVLPIEEICSLGLSIETKKSQIFWLELVIFQFITNKSGRDQSFCIILKQSLPKTSDSTKIFLLFNSMLLVKTLICKFLWKNFNFWSKKTLNKN